MRLNYGTSGGTGAVSRAKNKKWKKTSVAGQAVANRKRQRKSTLNTFSNSGSKRIGKKR